MVKWGLIFGWDEGCGCRNLPPTPPCLPSTARSEHRLCGYNNNNSALATAPLRRPTHRGREGVCMRVHVCVYVCVSPLVCSYYMLAYFRTPLQLREFIWTRNPVLLEESVWLFQEDRRNTEGLSENTVWCILDLQEAPSTDITDGTMWLFLFYRYELERLGLQENTIYYRYFCYLQTVIKD